MRYRISKQPFSIDGFSPVRLVNTNVPGGLGFTYPNPIQQRGKLWLFWRGGGWNPTFSYTRNGKDWVPARELLRLPHRGAAVREVRAATARPTSTASSPRATPTTSTTASTTSATRTTTSSAERAARSGACATSRSRSRKLERIYKFTKAKGSAWPHDIALTSRGRPRIVYTRRVGNRDTFFYAYNNGERWISRKIVEAGPGFPSFTSGGATLDHEDPRIVYLSRRTGAFHQVEAWFTPDDGRTWRLTQLTNEPSHYCIRPVTPRALRGANLVLFSRGDRSTVGLHRLPDAHPRAGRLQPAGLAQVWWTSWRP